jgi:hypothetical protein
MMTLPSNVVLNRKNRILIAEDDSRVSQLMVDLLQMSGVISQSVENGDDVLPFISTGEFDRGKNSCEVFGYSQRSKMSSTLPKNFVDLDMRIYMAHIKEMISHISK